MKSNSRDYIIASTAQLFNINGIRSTTLADICKATGMTKGAVYANFQDKGELALEVFRYNMRRLEKMEADVMQLRDSPFEKLMLFLDFYERAFQYKEFEFGCPLANAAPEVDDTDLQLLAEVRSTLTLANESLSALIRESIELGELTEEADADFAYEMLSSIEGGLLLSKATDDLAYLKRAVQMLKARLNSWKV